ncbi:MAG TPA: peptidoglycan binding domain-containing protein, partial [Chloroflexota bacterium]|nr:peptidoglycan binding domain-containing protein [Chloroflexota bacterium]
MAAPTRYPLAATLPADVLERTVAPKFGFPFRLFLLLGLLPLLLGASVLATYRQQQEERVYTGVRVFGLDLSRMRREEASRALRGHLQELGRRRFDLLYDDQAVTVSLTTLGLTADESDLNSIAERAWTVGRSDDLRTWLGDQLTLVRHGFDLPVTLKLDRERAAAVLGRIAPDVERVTLNADISVQRAGDRFEIHTAPAQTGRRLNVEATLDQLQASLTGRLPDSLDLVLVEAPPVIGDADLMPARASIEQLLGGAVEFRDGARSWRLEPAAAFEMLEIVGLKERTLPVTARLSEEKLAQWVERTARAADDPAVNPFFELDGEQIVVRPGRNGRLADAQATFEAAREIVNKQDARVVEIVFKEDKPWLQPQDLETARQQMNAVLETPILIETPALPGITEKKWTLGRRELLQMIVLPSTRNAPREYATLPPAQRPRYEVFLDSGRVANFVGREVAPWVSEDPVDAALELRTTRVDLPNPDFSPDSQLPERVVENRHRVELRNARDGRGPDFDGTFALVQAALRASYAALPNPLPTPLPVLEGEAIEPRRVTVRLAARRPRVVDADLAPAQAQANVLIEEPVVVRSPTINATWTVS